MATERGRKIGFRISYQWWLYGDTKKASIPRSWLLWASSNYILYMAVLFHNYQEGGGRQNKLCNHVSND